MSRRGRARMLSEPVVVLWWLPFAAFVLLLAWLLGFHGDVWLADRLYAWEGGRWSLRSHWLSERVLHTGGRWTSVLVWLGVVAAWVVTLLRTQWSAWRRPLGYLALTVLLSTGLISALKSFSAVICPWDLERYGGTHAYRSLLQTAGDSSGGCFPAGHASAGYAWLALFFFFAAVKPSWSGRALALGIGLGLVFGIAQQLRGAHFLSHDVFTAMICWSVALVLGRLMLRPRVAGGAA